MSASILLIDDDPLLVQMMGAMLSSLGRIRFATSGPTALQLAHALPDVILPDAKMPGMNGFDVCKTIRSSAFDDLLSQEWKRASSIPHGDGAIDDTVSVSTGGAVHMAPGPHREMRDEYGASLVRRADAALYRAKQQGRARRCMDAQAACGPGS